MSKKYKELPAFETNEFKVGDKVICYDSAVVVSVIHTVTKVFPTSIILSPGPEEYKGMDMNFKQCRKLEEIKPREYSVNIDAITGNIVGPFSSLNSDNFKTIKVREVMDDE
ncbi:MAG TPA: hypothetical protein VIS27_09640 [Yeosuana sp.]